jgi:histidinol-phosphatase
VAGYEDDLRLALVIADMVDSHTTSRFGALDLQVETKPDLTPVSDADKAAEEIIRGQLKRSRPRDAVIGEEFAPTGHAQRQWIVDPIDGTKNFVRGVPVWATLIAMVEDGVPVVGVVSAPAMTRRWWAASGIGAWTGRSLSAARRLSVSKVSRLDDASLSYSSYHSWADAGLGTGFETLTRSVWRSRAYGDFWSYMLLAEGGVDVACEPQLAVYDMAALVPVVLEAGGSFTSLDGEPGCSGGNALATNGLLHEEVLSLLRTDQNLEASRGASSNA